MRSILFVPSVSSSLKSKETISKLRAKNMGSKLMEFDVVVVGAGIVGLSIARQFLLGSDLEVALLDAAVPCSSATGAEGVSGQGYIWMGHRTPGTALWDLSMRSKTLWERMADDLQNKGMSPLEVLGWKKTGSLLIGRTSEEFAMLKQKVELLSKAGLRAECLSSSGLNLKEPALEIGKEGGAAFVPDESQLDASRTVNFILKENRNFASKGRYVEFFHDPVVSLIRGSTSGEVKGVRTSKKTLHCRKAVVIAAGSWSGSLMQSLLSELNIGLDVPIVPRKGQLLVLEKFNLLPLNHAVMEIGYVDHQVASLDPDLSTSDVVDSHRALTISMSATTDAMGNLVLGSSHQFAGFNTEAEDSTIHYIWKRAGEFFPTLRQLDLSDLSECKKVRVGLRPYMPDGKPIISLVPGFPNLLLTAGHEGEGLSMEALGTAEMVFDMVLGNKTKVDCTPFSVQGRSSC
ncbi:hypothetical protein Sjap_006041 [Stephania japonica]|uniref:FAD-dependent oxidoreductase domain-containing protein 1 n=1 Tax=Stephania japonica TaxID=461633 RepID=A0AAP0PIJ2_9MAGN